PWCFSAANIRPDEPAAARTALDEFRSLLGADSFRTRRRVLLGHAVCRYAPFFLVARQKRGKILWHNDSPWVQRAFGVAAARPADCHTAPSDRRNFAETRI